MEANRLSEHLTLRDIEAAIIKLADEKGQPRENYIAQLYAVTALGSGLPARETVERNKSSIVLTYRRSKKEGVPLEVTGFDVKVYADTPEQAKVLLEGFEQLGKDKVSQQESGL